MHTSDLRDELLNTLDRLAAERASAWPRIVAAVRQDRPVATGAGELMLVADADLVDAETLRDRFGGDGRLAVAAVLHGDTDPHTVTLTTDGLPVSRLWHQGDSSDQVYAERWTRGALVFAGWVDAASRRLVQGA